jgi:hypothetical protein
MMKRMVFLMLLIFLVWPVGASAGRLHSKHWYQERWCARMAGARAEPASSVYDCRTDTYVIEFDYADHWYEAIGESLHYALQTGKKAGIVLIMEHASDRRYWEKLNRTIDHYRLPIHTWQTSRGVAPP